MENIVAVLEAQFLDYGQRERSLTLQIQRMIIMFEEEGEVDKAVRLKNNQKEMISRIMQNEVLLDCE